LKNFTNLDISQAYLKAVQLAKSHYENFPVISFLVPRKFINDIAIIYYYARMADDVADEGDLTKYDRLQKLTSIENDIINASRNECTDIYTAALNNSIVKCNMNPDNLLNLIKAFKQDVEKQRYDDYEELLNYCVYSANPVGRMILEIFDVFDREAVYYSDCICTALQLTNFCQDVYQDISKGRIYLPQDDMKMFNVTDDDIKMKVMSSNVKSLLEYEINRIKRLFKEGRCLIKYLPYRLSVEIKWTISGGEKILDKIEKNDYDILDFRPKLNKCDFLQLFMKSIF